MYVPFTIKQRRERICKQCEDICDSFGGSRQMTRLKVFSKSRRHQVGGRLASNGESHLHHIQLENWILRSPQNEFADIIS